MLNTTMARTPFIFVASSGAAAKPVQGEAPLLALAGWIADQRAEARSFWIQSKNTLEAGVSA